MTETFAEPDYEFEDNASDSEADINEVLEENYTMGNSSEDENSSEYDNDEEEEEEDDVKDENDENFEPKKTRSQSSYLRTKHGYIWSKKPPQLKVTNLNKQNYESSPIGSALEVRSPIEAWSLLLSDEILKIMVKHTNEEISRHRGSSDTKDLSYHKQIDLLEMKAYIGLLYYTSLFNINNILDLWSIHGLPLFRATMSRRRYEYLSMCIRFDDKNTREERRQTDKFTNIRDVWELFLNNCNAYYEPSSDCIIKEELLKFRGNCAFKTHIPSRQHRYGLKIFTINDSSTQYMFNAVPYMPTANQDPIENVPSLYMSKLCETIYHTDRNVTTDNWFTSVLLARQMRDEYNLTMIGNLRKSKPEIPFRFRKVPVDKSNSQFCYNDNMTLVSHNPKRKKIAVYLSSLHSIGKMNEAEKKPEIVLAYENAKNDSIKFDKKSMEYSVTRKTARWSMRILYFILDQSNVNAFILYSLCSANSLVQRRDFIFNLSLALVKPLLQHRLTLPTLRLSLRKTILEFLSPNERPDDDFASDEVVSNILERRKNCQICPASYNRKTRFFCIRCRSNMCKEHTARICVKCEKHL